MYINANLKATDFEFSGAKVCREFNKDLRHDSLLESPHGNSVLFVVLHLYIITFGLLTPEAFQDES